MFVVLYIFTVKNNKEEEFIKVWSDLTKAIYKNCNSLGSRLHKESDNVFIATAQWPDESTFETSILPDEFTPLRNKMREFCSVEVLSKMEVVEDLLVNQF